ncbi:transporter [Angomonas deanei]|nr:transporter [Angomonas deanei]|eukprot:EPY34913.1 transporter [Angomonas deanei]
MSGQPAIDVSVLSDGYRQRISELGESSVLVDLGEIRVTAHEQRRIGQLNFFKRWYLLCHLAYMLSIVLAGTAALRLTEGGSLGWVDALFVSMSAACNCGLQTVNMSTWKDSSHVIRHIVMILGGVVFTSMYQPILRIVLLYRWGRFLPHENDSPSEGRLRETKRVYADRIRIASILSVLTTASYFILVHCIAFLLLVSLNSSNLSFWQAVSITLTSFHGCVFSSLVAYAGDPCVVLVVSSCCALGFTAFPVLLRLFFHLARLCSSVMVRLKKKFLAGDAQSVVTPLLSHGPVPLIGNRWLHGFEDILMSSHPGNFHPFLFLKTECTFLGVAWLLLTLFQAAPFWFEQWHGVLKAYGTPYKVFLSVCQAASVRFAAASFVPLHEYSNAHIAVTILAMYLPALPISTDRTYRKWKEMFRTSLFRLLTSRLFWLFSALLCILFKEENEMREKVRGTRFDIMTRAFFEIISGYSGCGLSLSLLPSDVSFIGSASSFSKVIIILVLFGGRHRFVDLGIDLGLNMLQQEVRLRVND